MWVKLIYYNYNNFNLVIKINIWWKDRAFDASVHVVFSLKIFFFKLFGTILSTFAYFLIIILKRRLSKWYDTISNIRGSHMTSQKVYIVSSITKFTATSVRIWDENVPFPPPSRMQGLVDLPLLSNNPTLTRLSDWLIARQRFVCRLRTHQKYHTYGHDKNWNSCKKNFANILQNFKLDRVLIFYYQIKS